MEKSRNQLIMDEQYRIRDDVLNAVSPSFCTAKWLQSTVYLWNGFTHSCHHPSAHKVDPDVVKANPRALHNSPIKFVARADMLKGIQTPECNYCWNIENAGNHLSDRTYKSTAQWSLPHLEKVKESGLGADINPTYLEIAFENTCNLKCTYCTPDVSSKWVEEIERHGHYELEGSTMHNLDWLKQTGKFPIRKDEYNPYVEAFWKWWPELIQSLEVFRITGGEPLLSKHTWAVFDYLIENPQPGLSLAMNTNLCVPKKLIDRLVEYTKKLEGKVKNFEIYTSLEATGPQAEYIRFGMNYQEFMDNCDYLLTHTNTRLHFMVATNLLSVTTFDQFLIFVHSLREKFNETDAENRIPMMISYVRWPNHLNIRHLSDDIKTHYGKRWIETVMARTRQADPTKAGRFYLEEVDQVERLIEFMHGTETDTSLQRRNFFLYHQQYDERRKVSFDNVFPELSDFMTECGTIDA